MKHFLLAAATALAGATASQAATVMADVTCYITPDSCIQYVAEMELQDPADTTSYFNLPLGIANYGEGYDFSFRLHDGELQFWGSSVTDDGYSDDNMWVGANGTCYNWATFDNPYFLYNYNTDNYGYEIADDYTSGALTFYIEVYDYEKWECISENYFYKTSIQWPAKGIVSSHKAKYTCGRDGEGAPARNVVLNMLDDSSFSVPAFLGADGYNLDFSADGLWCPWAVMCYNPQDFDASYAIELVTKMPTDWQNTGKEYMTVSKTVCDVENRTFTMEYTWCGDSTTVYTDVLKWQQAGIEDVEADSEAGTAPAQLFNLQGQPVRRSDATPGIYIERRGTRASKVVIK